MYNNNLKEKYRSTLERILYEVNNLPKCSHEECKDLAKYIREIIQEGLFPKDSFTK